MKSKLILNCIFIFTVCFLFISSANGISPFKGINVSYPNESYILEQKYLYLNNISTFVYWDFIGGLLFSEMGLFNGTIANITQEGIVLVLDGEYVIYKNCSDYLQVAILPAEIVDPDKFVETYLKYTDSFCMRSIPENAYEQMTSAIVFDGNNTYIVSEITALHYQEWKSENLENATEVGKYFVNNNEIKFYKVGLGDIFIGIYNGSFNETKLIYAVTCSEIDDNCLKMLSENETISINITYEVNTFSVIIDEIILSLAFAFAILFLPYLHSLIKEREIPLWWRTKTYLTLSLSVGLLIAFYLIVLSFSVWVFFIFLVAPILVMLTIKDIGIPLKRNDAPKLFKMVEDLAKKMNVKLPKKIILTPDTGIGVSGFIHKKLFIGYGGILSLDAKSLHCVLAHEFAHLKGFDTLVGGGLMTMKMTIDRAVYLSSFIRRISFGFVIWLGLWIYDIIYSFLILAYSRQREFIADRRAALLVGPKAFAESFEKYVKNSYLFDVVSHILVLSAISKKKIFKNIYKAFLEWKKVSKDEIKRIENTKKIEKMKFLHKLFSTHPEREKRLQALSKMKNFKTKHPSGKAIDLIKNRNKIEKKLTEVYTEFALKRSGLELVKEK